MKSDTEKVVICGFPISTAGLQENLASIMQQIKERKSCWVVTLNLEMIYRSKTDDTYRNLLQSADLFVADGVPLIWASKYKKDSAPIAGRSNGTDLVEKILDSDYNFRLGVIGGTDPASVVKKYNPGLLTSAYFYDGNIDLNNTRLLDEIIERLSEQKINLLFLSLGVPKQDQLAQKIREQIDSISVIGVGGSFDLLSGRKPRAPKWMQKNGLEWFYRLATEPKRLAKRYIIHYPKALYAVIKDIF